MKIKIVALIAGLALCSAVLAKTDKTADPMAPRHKRWLTRIVPYIMTPVEKKVFNKLVSHRERDVFIRAFWKQRDPNPNTPVNEFKEEHMRRLDYASRILGRGTPSPGWRTDMGRIYIILGEPRQIEIYDNDSQIYPVVIWFYQGMAARGLPNAFNLVFFKEYHAGDYKLYSPVQHGPARLLIHYTGDVNDNLQAYKELININESVARVSLSLIPDEPVSNFTPSIMSEVLVSEKIVKAPAKLVNDHYATRLLKMKEIVDVEYTANYVESRALVRVFYHPFTGCHFIHYLIEPQKLSVEGHDGRYYARLQAMGSLQTSGGKQIHQFSKDVPLEFNTRQLESASARKFSFQDVIPVIPGKYHFNVIIKNTVASEFMSLDAEVEVPQHLQSGLSEPVLACRTAAVSAKTNQIRPFLQQGMQLVPVPGGDFSAADDLNAFFKLRVADRDLQDSGRLVCSIYRDDSRAGMVLEKKQVRPLKEIELPNVIERFSLAGMRSAYYLLKIAVLTAEGKVKYRHEKPFLISPVKRVQRPWTVTLSMHGKSPDIFSILGHQYIRSNDLRRGGELLARAYHLQPGHAQVARDYCGYLYLKKDFAGLEKIALSFTAEKEKEIFLVLLASVAQARKEFRKAISLYKQHLAAQGSDMKVLNAIGTCYSRLGEKEAAREAWQKSLELFPDQDKLKAYIKQ